VPSSAHSASRHTRAAAETEHPEDKARQTPTRDVSQPVFSQFRFDEKRLLPCACESFGHRRPRSCLGRAAGLTVRTGALPHCKARARVGASSGFARTLRLDRAATSNEVATSRV
jgi:hypothetical protein